jgi:chemotaxis protein MotB
VTSRRDRWILSYADFITLLLALFVVLYASARLDADRGRTLIEGIGSAFPLHDQPGFPIREARDPSRPEPASGTGLLEQDALLRARQDLEALLESERRREDGSILARVHEDPRGVVLSLASTGLFPVGAASIRKEQEAVLDSIAPILAASDRPLLIEGHTDDRPIQNDLYPSNWELSAARAAAIARFFIARHEIDPSRVSATGYAEFRPVAPNTSASRRARNRRVEIILRRESLPTVPSDPAAAAAALGRLVERLPPLPESIEGTSRPQRSPDPSQRLPPP